MKLVAVVAVVLVLYVLVAVGIGTYLRAHNPPKDHQ